MRELRTLKRTRSGRAFGVSKEGSPSSSGTRMRLVAISSKSSRQPGVPDFAVQPSRPP